LNPDLLTAKTDLDSEMKENAKLSKLKTKLEQDLQAFTSKSSQEGMVKSQMEAKIKQLEDELNDTRDKFSKTDDLRAKLEKDKKSVDATINDLNERLDDEVQARLKAEALVRDLESEKSQLKEQLDESARKSEVAQLKQQLEQQDKLNTFKLEREIDLRKKADEAVAAIKHQYEELYEQFENAARERSKQDKHINKSRGEFDEINSKLNAEVKKREVAEQKLKEAKEELLKKVGPVGIPSEQLKAIQVEADDLRIKLEAATTTLSTLEKKNKSLLDEVDQLKQLAEDESAQKEKNAKARREVEDKLADVQESLSDAEHKYNEMEDQKRKKEIEIEDYKKRN